MYKIIGIDPGANCGWAVLAEDGQLLSSGVWDLNPRRQEGGGMRFLRCRAYLIEAINSLAGSDVVLGYEEVRRHRGVDAAHVYGGIVSQVTAVCEELSIPYQALPVGTVKKFATGKGNASKMLMIEASNKRWFSNPTEDDNEADARWIADLLRETLGFGPRL
jgi:Holliday junction resolvasome RuvABC endonuclease subunit